MSQKEVIRELNDQVRMFKDQRSWERWLEHNGGSSSGIWLRLAKKSAALKSTTYQEAVESALCYGWIDGQSRSFDDQSWLQKFTPRRSGSVWSAINRGKALTLIKEGRMRKAGLEAIEAAKLNGRWKSAYDSVRNSSEPADFLAELRKNRAAKEFFSTLNSANRYAILWRIQTARKAETRRKRIAQFVQMLADHQKFHP